MIKPFMLSILILLCTACSERVIVTQVETHLIAPPQSLLINCKVNKVEEDTVHSLAKAYIKNNKSIKECNNNIDAIRKWTNKQVELYESGSKQ